MENTNPLFSRTEILIPNWNEIPNGSKFTGSIKEVEVSGRIYRNFSGQVFLCQNTFDGLAAENLFEFRYSWCIDNGTLNNMLSNDVIIISIELDPDFNDTLFVPIRVVLNESYQAIVSESGINIGCQFIDFSAFDRLAKAVEEVRAKYDKKNSGKDGD